MGLPGGLTPYGHGTGTGLPQRRPLGPLSLREPRPLQRTGYGRPYSPHVRVLPPAAS
jgi:hypothetical protein